MANKQTEYQVRFRCVYILGIDVKAETVEQAEQKARKIVQKIPDQSGPVSLLDYSENLIGYDNTELWSID